MSTECNPVQQRQEVEPPGASGRVQGKGDGGETGDLLPFACIMGSAQRVVAQGEGTPALVFPGEEEAKGSSDTGEGPGKKGSFFLDPENLLNAVKGPVEKADRSLLGKGKGIAEGVQKDAHKGGKVKGDNIFVQGSAGEKETKGPAPLVNESKGKEGTKGPALLVNGSKGNGKAKVFTPPLHASEGREGEKAPHPFPAVSKGKGVKTGEISPGMTRKEGGQRIGGEGEWLPKNGPSTGDKTQRMHPLTGLETGQLRSGSRETGLQTTARKPETTGMTIGKNEQPVTDKGNVAGNPVGKDAGNAKGVITALRNSGIKGGEHSPVMEEVTEPLKADVRHAAVVKGRVTLPRNEQNGAGEKSPVTKDVSEPVKATLTDTATVVPKGKNTGERGGMERGPYTIARGGDRSDTGSQLGLKGETASGEHEQTGVKEPRDHAAGILHRGTSRSAPPSERGFSVGGYQQTALHAGEGSTAPPENVKTTPRALIDQIADGAKMSGRVRIALNPPSLGTVDMDVLVRDNKVHIILQAESSDVKQILQSSMDSLKVSLRNQGLVADTIQVFAQEKSDGSGYYESGRNAAWFGEGNTDNQSRNERELDGGDTDLSPPVSSLPEEEPRHVVAGDGRLNVFA